MSKRSVAFLVLLSTAFAFQAREAAGFAILYVDDDQALPATADGTTWSKAYKDLRLAIQKATTQPATFPEIRVAGGRYPTTQSTTQPSESFHLLKLVAIRGGYRGLSDLPNADTRDVDANVSILTGDIDGDGLLDDDNAVVVVDARQPNSSATDNTAVLDGFTITGGNGGAPVAIGENEYSAGAGLYCPGTERTGTASSPFITNCLFIGNRTKRPGHPQRGGGLFVGVNSNLNISGCTFIDNEAGDGGGVYMMTPGTSFSMARCTFIKNKADEAGGGAVFILAETGSSPVPFINCVFRRNESLKAEGGAIFAGLTNSRELRIINGLFDRNFSVKSGGGIYAESSSTLNLVNCTLSGNRSTVAQGGGVFVNNSTATLVNCILRGNESIDSGLFDKQLATNFIAITLNYSHVEGCASCGGTGNSGGDPKFVNASAGNLHLKSDSPCKDAGDNSSYTSAGGGVDLDGHTRPASTSQPVDRGPYEIGAAINSDCNNNGIDDKCETNCGAMGCSGVPGCGTAPDCDHNDVPDVCDIAADRSLDCDGDGVMNACESPPFVDCNRNCRVDSADITCGGNNTCDDLAGSFDCNGNGVPDECEFVQPLVATTTDDFNRGTKINLNTGAGGLLQRNTADATKPLPYLWVPTQKPGSNIVRINTAAAASTQPTTIPVLGEYRASPSHHIDESPSLVPVVATPERVAVDLDGSVWAGDKDDNFNNQGAVVKIGSVMGGTRVNANGALDPHGQYLKAPFKYCTCEDRDGDGLIKTSRGYGDALPWENIDGRDDNGGVENAEDECIIRYSRVSGTEVRLVAIDRQNNVWVGGSLNHEHQKLNGFSGAVEAGTGFNPGIGGGGGLVDCQNYVWATSSDGSNVLWFDPSDLEHSHTVQVPSTGTGIDLLGNLWFTRGLNLIPGEVRRVKPNWEVGDGHDTGGSGGTTGICIAPSDGNIWVANSGNSNGSDVSRLNSTATVVRKVISVGTSGGEEPTAISIDAAGKVWTACYNTSSVVRIDPGADTDGLGKVDLTVDLNTPTGPDCLGDMTGMVALQTSATGTWSIVHDGVDPGIEWGCVRWNTENCASPPIPFGTSLDVSVRAAEKRLALTTQPYTEDVPNGASLSGLVGRFVEVRVRFHGTCPEASFATPVLCDLEIRPVVSCVKGNCNHDAFNKINGDDIQPFVRALLGATTCLFDICPADMNNNGTVTSADIPCFLNKLVNPNGVDSCSGYNACGQLEAPSPRSGDCNTNGTPDDNDIAAGTSQDCNNNFIPDECDIAAGDPDGDGHVSNDVDANGVPDECQTDCNHNSVPDAKDIAVATSNDVNSNGVPDECEKDCNHNSIPDSWDISQHTSADCNANGIPDSCESDCNSNGVPDDCDIDPTDPDGDSVVYPDCNNSSLPDECDFNLSLHPSYDCNENGIPDECDIASEYSTDTNTNGIPDECDYILGRAGGTEGQSEFDAEAAWLEFYEWEITEHDALMEMYPADRFQATLDKLYELGLPEAIPWAHVATP